MAAVAACFIVPAGDMCKKIIKLKQKVYVFKYLKFMR